MRRALAIVTTIATACAGSLILFASPAAADPSAADWHALRMCESTNRYNINTGNGYYGAYQFDLSTWRSVGGTGYPHEASPEEQDYRALRLYRMRGWEPWTCARMVGLQEDSDARSRVLPPAPGNQSSGSGASEGGSATPTPAPAPAPAAPAPAPAAPAPAASGSSDDSGAPAYPGRQFREGDYSESLKAWQRQMGSRGYPLVGTGYFGPKTKAAVLDLQAKAGLNVVGYIGPKTWAAAWSSGAASTAAAPAPTPTYTPPTNESCGVGNATAPTWPGRQFVRGDAARELACFQRQLGSRGYGLTGSGYYGDNTAAAVVQLQQRNGINASGIIGQQTWTAAWEGS